MVQIFNIQSIGWELQGLSTDDQSPTIGAAANSGYKQVAYKGSTTDGDDHIIGTDADESLYGAAGDDTLEGAAGDDRLEGGDGNDLLIGGDGDDILYGDGDDDTLYGGAGTDSLIGGDGDDLLISNGGSDFLSGWWGNDTLVASGDGDITFNGAFGDNIYAFEEGFTGSVRISSDYASTTDILDLTNFVDNLERLEIDFSSGITIYALDADGDRIASINFDGGTYAPQIKYGDDVWDIKSAETSDDIYYALGITSKIVHRIQGTPNDDVIIAGTNDTVYAGDGDDELRAAGDLVDLYGDEGNDTLSTGGFSQTKLSGGNGNDLFVVDWNNDSDTDYFWTTLLLGEDDDQGLGGSDTLDLSALSTNVTDFIFEYRFGFVIRVLGENGDIIGSIALENFEPGTDTQLDFIKIGDDVFNIDDTVVDPSARGFAPQINSDIRYQTSDADEVIHSYGQDTVFGLGGNDYIYSGGNDELYGGAGDDTLSSNGHTGVKLDGGPGDDVFVITPWDEASDYGPIDVAEIDSWRGDLEGANGVLDLSAFSLDDYQFEFTNDSSNIVIKIIPNDGSAIGEVTLDDGFQYISTLKIGDQVWDLSEVNHTEELNLLFVDGLSGYDAIQPFESVSLSGDELIDGLLQGSRYVAHDGGDTIDLTYSFANTNSYFVDGYGDGEADGITFSYGGENMAAYLFDMLSRYTNLAFDEVGDQGEFAGIIRFSYTQDLSDEFDGWGYFPNNGPEAGDIWLNSDTVRTSEIWFGQLLMHELGHALGLKHPFETIGQFPLLPTEFDGLEHTVMSYSVSAQYPTAVAASLYPQTFMALDIKALQYLYGIDTITTGGADKYHFYQNQNNFLTIWDAGGNDTISVATYSTEAVAIDLTPGTWSDIGTTITYQLESGSYAERSQTLYIMDDTIIENALGGAGDDTLTGNDADNRLIGMAGSDLVLGGAGDDIMWAGAGDTGDDSLFGGSGQDIIGGGAGDDLVVGNSGADQLMGGAGNDTLIAGDWLDDTALANETSVNTLWAGDGGDLLYGANGNDLLGGGLGDDTIYGADGADVIFAGKSGTDSINGGAGDDLVFGGSDDDTIEGGSGADELYGGSGNDTMMGGAGSDTMYGGAGADLMDGGTGNDILRPGGGADTLVFVQGHGADIIGGWNSSEDALDLSDVETDFLALSDIQAAASEASINNNEGLLIETGGGDSIFLIGLNLDDLTAMSFIL